MLLKSANFCFIYVYEYEYVCNCARVMKFKGYIEKKENTHNLLKYLILAKPLVQKLLIGSTNEISTLPTGLDIDNRIINLCLFA